MKKDLLSAFALLILVAACSKTAIEPDQENLLAGTWNYTGNQNDLYIFSRSREFVNGQGYRFNSDGSLTERKNSGWCGTPPISYSDYQGTWTKINDTLISINVASWGGPTSYKIDIEHIDNNSFTARYIYDSE